MSMPNAGSNFGLIGQYGRSVYVSNLAQGLQYNATMTGVAVTQHGGGANMSVDVSAGAWFASTTFNMTTGITNVTITAADASNDRYDVIYANSSGTIAVSTGTAASPGTQQVPQMPANSIALAIVYVQHGASSITNSVITDMRLTANFFSATNTANPSLSSTVIKVPNGSGFTTFSNTNLASADVDSLVYGVTPQLANAVVNGVNGAFVPLPVIPCIASGDSFTLTETCTTNPIFIKSVLRTNYAYGNSPTASTVFGWTNSGTLSQVVDGDLSTGGYTAALTTFNTTEAFAKWLVVDLGAAQAIQTASVGINNTGGSSTDYPQAAIYYSTDNITFHQLQTINLTSNGFFLLTWNGAGTPQTARYWAVYLGFNSGTGALVTSNITARDFVVWG